MTNTEVLDQAVRYCLFMLDRSDERNRHFMSPDAGIECPSCRKFAKTVRRQYAELMYVKRRDRHL